MKRRFQHPIPRFVYGFAILVAIVFATISVFSTAHVGHCFGTSLLTIACAALFYWLQPKFRDQSSMSAALFMMGVVTAYWALSLVLIWNDVFGWFSPSNSELIATSMGAGAAPLFVMVSGCVLIKRASWIRMGWVVIFGFAGVFILNQWIVWGDLNVDRMGPLALLLSGAILLAGALQDPSRIPWYVRQIVVLLVVASSLLVGRMLVLGIDPEPMVSGSDAEIASRSDVASFLWQMLFFLVSFGLGIFFAVSSAMSRLILTRAGWLRWCALVFLMVTIVFGILFIYSSMKLGIFQSVELSESLSEWMFFYGRIFVAFLLITFAFLLMIGYFNRFKSKILDPATDIMITLTCPRCQLSCTMPRGKQACPDCQLAFEISFEDPTG